jgi:hypothetical protein
LLGSVVCIVSLRSKRALGGVGAADEASFDIAMPRFEAP